MSDKLKIYACNGIGSTSEKYGYWTDNTNSVNNTQAVNSLLAKINYNYAQAVYLDLSAEETAKCLDNIDLYCVCMYYARKYADEPGMLHQVGKTIGEMVAAGMFESNLLTDEERDSNLDRLFEKVEEMQKHDPKEDAVFMQWWKEEVEDLNQTGFTEGQQNIIKKELAGDGVSAVDYGNDDLNVYLNDAGTYFLYTFFSVKQLAEVSPAIRRKAKVQKQMYQHCLSLYKKLNGSQAAMDQIIRTGIIETMHDTPENLVNGIYDKFVSGEAVGTDPITVATTITIGEIIQIITIIANLIIAIIAKICEVINNKNVLETESVNAQAMSTATPNEDDYPESWVESTGNNKYLLYGAIAAIAFFLLRR